MCYIIHIFVHQRREQNYRIVVSYCGSGMLSIFYYQTRNYKRVINTDMYDISFYVFDINVFGRFRTQAKLGNLSLLHYIFLLLRIIGLTYPRAKEIGLYTKRKAN